MSDEDKLDELKELLSGSPYRPRSWLGRGAAADVFVVQHDHLGKKFALKLVHPHLARASGYIERLRREARALGRMDPKHIVRVVDLALATNGAPYLVMELMKGVSLSRELMTRRRIPLREAVGWARAILEGLSSAHELGVVHRDISPDNLFLKEVSGYARVLKILDFGLAGVLPGAAEDDIRGGPGMTTSTGMLVGSPGYASPEAMRGEKLDTRADIYGVGVVLFEMVTGMGPFDLEDVRVPAPSGFVSDLPPEFDAALLRAVEFEKDSRYPSAQEFSQALSPFLVNDLMSENDNATPPRLNLYCQKHKETWTVMLGPGWVPPPLRPFFDENFESGHVLLDFEYLKDSLEARGATCDKREAKNGSVELTARDTDAKSLARWLGNSLSSGMVKR